VEQVDGMWSTSAAISASVCHHHHVGYVTFVVERKEFASCFQPVSLSQCQDIARALVPDLDQFSTMDWVSIGIVETSSSPHCRNDSLGLTPSDTEGTMHNAGFCGLYNWSLFRVNHQAAISRMH